MLDTVLMTLYFVWVVTLPVILGYGLKKDISTFKFALLIGWLIAPVILLVVGLVKLGGWLASPRSNLPKAKVVK